MTQKQEDNGASLRDRAASLRPQPAAQSSQSGITGAAWLAEMADRCRDAAPSDQSRVLCEVASAFDHNHHFYSCEGIGEYVGAAIALLPPGCEWRKYTDGSFTVYAASPYNAKAQVPFEGYGATHALALTCANLRMRHHQAAYREARDAQRCEP